MCVKHVQSCPFGEMGLTSKKPVNLNSNHWSSFSLSKLPCGICQFSTHPHLLTSKIKVCVFKWGMFSLVPPRFFWRGSFSYTELEAKK